ncbi:cell filamentation protein [Burkholderia latens]|uniref:Fic/DOC family protein n=1 Tax=Burkholderia latens TaxID=488446 RepID=UPI0039A4A541
MPKYPADSKDPYTDPASGLLRNRLGITDAAELDRVEATFAAVRSYELDTAPAPARFDLEHLREIHRTLFGDVYPWAGELRSVDIAKGDTRFANAAMIESAGAQLFRQLDREGGLRGLDADGFSARAGHYLGEVNVLHPFREGNGRAQRAFINQIAHAAGYHIGWANVTREEMTRASIEAYHGSSERMAGLIRANLTDRDRERALELARSTVGELARLEHAAPGQSYTGRVVGATERYIVQERQNDPGAMVLHSRRSVDADAEKMRGRTLEIRYPHGGVGLVRDTGARDVTKDLGKALQKDRGREK